MTASRRTLPRWVLSLAALALAAALAAPVSADASSTVAPGDEELTNLEHVWNFNFQEHTPANPEAQGSDLEFFTVTVPLRDYETGAFVDEQGEVLEDGAEPVLAEHDFAAVGGYSRGGYIFDITDPEEPALAAFVECAQPRNDVGIRTFVEDDGSERVLLALTQQRGPPCITDRIIGPGNGGIAVFDVTDPVEWEPLYSVAAGFSGVHNFAFHPTARVGYVWNGALPGGLSSIPLIDFADLDNPVPLSGPTTEGGPHDGEFSPDGNRLYVASENNYRIYDTSDPLDPVLISRTPNLGTYGHGVWGTPDGRTMITNNESLALGGFFANRSGVCPGEGLAFYDIEGDNEQLPIGPLASYVPDVVGRTPDHRACTSHFGRVAPNSQAMTIGWYVLGVRVVDISDPTAPRELGAAVMPPESSTSLGSEVWSAKTYRGPYVYTGDLGRGFDVFRWDGNPDCPAPWEDGWEPDCE